MKRLIKQNGFILIETVMYLFLFTALIGGVVSLFYSLLSNMEYSSAYSLETEEAEFLLKKIDWLITSFASLDVPLPHETSSVLSLATFSGDHFILKEENGKMLMQKNNEEFIALSNAQIKIENLIFESIEPHIIKASFSISRREFSVSKYNYAH